MPVRMQQSDTDLVAAIQNGDRRAFGVLYDRHKSAVFGYCRGMLRDRAATDDAVQEIFIHVHRSTGALKDAGAFLPWLYRIARNQVLMMLRAQRMEDLGEADTVWSNEDPYQTLVESETADILQRHLNALRPEYREALILREYQQLSYAEIAAVTESTESAVKSRIFKARRALADRIPLSEL
jgi:RNA polymerase sigma-70 factor (ECF subfamily)